jgi:hypothetical protein
VELAGLMLEIRVKFRFKTQLKKKAAKSTELMFIY